MAANTHSKRGSIVVKDGHGEMIQSISELEVGEAREANRRDRSTLFVGLGRGLIVSFARLKEDVKIRH